MLTQSFFILCTLLGTICLAAPYCGENYVTVTVYQTVYEGQYGHLSSGPPVPSLGTYYNGPASSPFSSAAGAFSHYGYQSPPSMAPAPRPTMSVSPSDHLIPSVPQDYDTQAMANLQPQKECMMYYEAQGSCKYIFITLRTIHADHGKQRSRMLQHSLHSPISSIASLFWSILRKFQQQVAMAKR
jgi:hypothetical protein